MLCVSRVSGEPVLELGEDELDALTSDGGSAVRAVKQRLRQVTGIGIFRQSLVHDGCMLEEKDKLKFPMDLQLVVTSCSAKMSAADFREMQNAVGENDTHRLEAVLQKGHDPDATDAEHQTSLHIAASWGHMASTRLLIEARANLGIKDCRGSTPLRLALKDNNLELAGLLISAGAGISGAQREAFEPGNLEVANLLLQAGIDVNEPGDDGRTPLHWVCLRGHLTVLHLLLEARASINATDSRNASPLVLAADWGKAAAVQMLIEAASDLDQATASGKTALQIALGNRRLDIARRLLEAGADWSPSPDSHQAPALLIASEQFDWYMVRLLLDARASVDAVDALGRTALHHAFQKPQDVESMDMARLLIERTADVNKTRDAEGCAPLHWMSQAGRSDRVPFLVEAKADLNLKNCRAETSLHLASRSGHHGVIKQLLDNGAETDLAAAGCGNLECTRLLIQARADVNRASLANGATPGSPIYGETVLRQLATPVTPDLQAPFSLDAPNVEGRLFPVRGDKLPRVWRQRPFNNLQGQRYSLGAC
ncbi:Ank2, partial [Symbiodinium necroappetens]